MALWGRHLRPTAEGLVSGLRTTCSPVPFIRSGSSTADVTSCNETKSRRVNRSTLTDPRESADPEWRMQVLQLSPRIKLNLSVGARVAL